MVRLAPGSSATRSTERPTLLRNSTTCVPAQTPSMVAGASPRASPSMSTAAPAGSLSSTSVPTDGFSVTGSTLTSPSSPIEIRRRSVT